MKFKVIADQVIIKPHEKREVSTGGVIIPDIAHEDIVTGDVIAVGPGMQNYYGKRNEMSCIIGDTVLYPKNAVRPITYNDIELIVIRENDICAILDEK